MIEIIPAVLEHSVEDVRAQLERLRGTSRVVQLDIVGQDFLAREESLPLWEEFDFEFDLMLPHPEGDIEHAIAVGASRIVVHAEAKGAREALEKVQHVRGGTFATEVGIALRVGDATETLYAFEKLYDYVQVMGIAEIGSQGQPFDERCIELVRALHDAHPQLTIQVDGGVSAEHVRPLVQAGASRLVVGSAILRADDPCAAYDALVKEANTL